MKSSDDRNGAEPKRTPDPRRDTTESAASVGWLYALNAFLERAFTEADLATGC
jgi:hypothetical protein